MGLKQGTADSTWAAWRCARTFGAHAGARAGRGRFASTMADQTGLTGATGTTAKEVQKKNEGCCEGGFKLWLMKNWVYVLCVIILVVGIVVEILLIVKPCDEQTTEIVTTSNVNVKCNQNCSFEVNSDMAIAVNQADKDLLNGDTFNASGCSVGECAIRFCKHVESQAAKAAATTAPAAPGRRLLSTKPNETVRLLHFRCPSVALASFLYVGFAGCFERLHLANLIYRDCTVGRASGLDGSASTDRDYTPSSGRGGGSFRMVHNAVRAAGQKDLR